MNTTTAPIPAITTTLLSKGRNTVGHETNLARSPLWNLRKRVAHPETVVSPALYGRPFRRVAGMHLTTADQQLFAYLTTMFVRGGCPDDRRVPLSLGEAAIALGYDDLGGKQRKFVRQSLARLGSVMLESAVRHPDGHETVLGWGLLDSYLVTTRGGGKGWATLSEAVSLLLREGSVTFLHAPTWHAISEEDEVAGRLWSFLESENLGRGWRYPLFPSEGVAGVPSGSPPPAVSEVVMLHWASRGEVAKRLRRACEVIEARDRRYRLEVCRGRAESTWFLQCSRGSQPSAKPRGEALPDSVRQAWRAVYKSHLPSARQSAILFEILDRHTSKWIVDALNEAHGNGVDPLQFVMDQDRQVSHNRLATARLEEGRWETEKQRLNTEAEQSLAEILLSVTGSRTTGK